MQQASTDAGDTTSSSLAFAASNTAGNFIAVALRAGRSHQVFSVSDSRGNPYRQAAQIDVTLDTPLGGTLAVFYAENTQAGANVVTVSQSTGATLRFAILEYSGVALASPLDGTAAAQGIGATPTSGGTTTTAGGNLVFGAIMTADARVFAAGTGFTIRTRVPAAPLTKLIAEDRIQPAAGAASATATLDASNTWGAVVAAFRAATVGPQPDLTLTKTHTGGFVRGQSGATYTLTVSNIGSASTAGSVTVADTLPSGLTATGISGSDWNCTLSGLSCTRSDALAAAESYPPITLTVSVAANAPVSVTNVASVTGGGDPITGNNTTSEVTPIGTGPDVQPPTAPGGLTATASGQDRINLNWTASTDDVGVTDYRVEQCQGAGCTDFTEIAQVEAAPAVAGPLTVSANPHYFKDTSGAALILNGSHTWNSLQDWGLNGSPQPFDFDAYVDFLLAHGHNFTLLWYIELPKFCYLPTTENSPPQFTVSPHPWQRTGPGTATDGAPKFDLTRFDQAYFDRLRARVEALNEAGIYAGVYTFTGEFVYAFRCSNDGYPFTGANNINGIDDGGGANSFTMTSPNAITAIQDAHVERVIDTLNDMPNVLWIVSQEASPGSLWWNDHQISHIRSYESGKPFQHPIGYGIPRQTSDSVLFNSDADWIAGGSKIAPTSSCGSGTPTCKVNVNDSDHPYFGMWNESAQANRNYAWQNFTNGNQVLFMDPYVVYYPREGRNLCSSPTNGICPGPDPRWQNFRDNLGAILTYSRKLNLTSVTPRGSLSSTSHCLAQTPSVGAEYLVYASGGGSFTVNLSAMSSSRTLTVEWFNPSTGATTFANPVPAGSTSQSFTPPFAGDAVLYLVDAEGHAGTVPVPTSYSDSGLAADTYRYRVRAADDAENLSSYSNIASATVQAPDCNNPALTIRANKTTLDWTPAACTPSSWGVATGLLSALRSSGSFGGASCLESGSLDATAVHAATPGPGSGFYYLVRVSGGTWNDGHQASDRNATLAACP